MRALFTALFFGVAATALAQDRTIILTAEVASVDDPEGVLAGEINPGDVIRGSYTYSLTAPDSNPLPTVGDYWHMGIGGYGFNLWAGELVFRSDPTNLMFLVELVNDDGTPASDNYLLRSYQNLPASCGVPVDHISWQLDDSAAIALSGTTLPATPPVLKAWKSNFGLMLQGPNASWSVLAHVNFVRPATRFEYEGPPARACEEMEEGHSLGPQYKAGTRVSVPTLERADEWPVTRP